jgi:hypothetical protein
MRIKNKIQGDVVLRKLDTLPSGVELVKENAKVLQQSEITGHHHQFTQDSKVDLYERSRNTDAIEAMSLTITPNMGKFIVVHEPSMLYHGKLFDETPHQSRTGDHNAFIVPPGIYEVDIVREYDYDYMEERRVVD